VGPAFPGGSGELLLDRANAQVAGLISLAGSSNLGTLFGEGTIAMTDSILDGAADAFLDTGTLDLADSRFSVAGNLRTEFFSAGSTPPGYVEGASGDVEIRLQRSLLSVGQEFALGVDDLLGIRIESADRITGYGAVDASIVTLLGGELEVVFDLAGLAQGMVFDLIVSGSMDGISGDFSNVSISGLGAGYSVIAGTVLDDLGSGLVEIYRLRIAMQVPSPAPLALLLSAGLLAVAVTRTRSAGRQVSRAA
jgi:hypothetical protein